jgi:GAF domain-containing protein
MHEPVADARVAAAVARGEPNTSAAAGTAVEPPSAPPAADRGLLDLQAICDLGTALGASTSDRHSGETIWFHLRSRTPATALALYRYDQASDTIACAHAAGADAQVLRDARIPVGERLSGWVAATRQGVMNSDARLDLDEAHRERSALRSALAVPIMADGRIAGVLSLYAPFENAFDEDHRRLAQAAAYAATALSRNSA